jgi:hypothetical protein
MAYLCLQCHPWLSQISPATYSADAHRIVCRHNLYFSPAAIPLMFLFCHKYHLPRITQMHTELSTGLICIFIWPTSKISIFSLLIYFCQIHNQSKLTFRHFQIVKHSSYEWIGNAFFCGLDFKNDILKYYENLRRNYVAEQLLYTG